jgi:hypothetical protein
MAQTQCVPLEFPDGYSLKSSEAGADNATMDNTVKRKRGRPTQHDPSALWTWTKLRPETKAAWYEAARRARRSLSAEIEARVESTLTLSDRAA